MTTRLRLAPSAALRLALVPQLLGLACVVSAVLLRALHTGSTAAATLVALGAGFLLAGFALRWVRPWVLRLDDTGYRIRLVRGAGSAAGSWAEVEDVVTAEVRSARCLVLRRQDGSRTVVPVDLLDRVDSEVVGLVREHLDAWYGRRRT